MGHSTTYGKDRVIPRYHISLAAALTVAGLFITKFRKIFARDEMNDDLILIPARHGQHDDTSEYEEILPTSPP